MGMLRQALEIIFEVQRKRINEKITREKISFLTYKTCFFFLLFGPFPFSNLITFLFFMYFKQFKVLQELHMKFYKLSLNSNNNIATYKMFFECLGTGFGNVQRFVFLSS
jgi:hypothetical protein